MRRQTLIRPGFTLTEVMSAILLLVIFFDVAGHVFRSTVLLSTASQDLCDRTSRIDSALHQLRADVWNCTSMKVSDPHSVHLAASDGKSISWKIDPQNAVVRSNAAGESERWEGIGAGWLLSADKTSLSISDSTSAPARMISQVLLAQSEQP